MFKNTCEVNYYYYPQFTDEGPEVLRGKLS